MGICLALPGVHGAMGLAARLLRAGAIDVDDLRSVRCTGATDVVAAAVALMPVVDDDAAVIVVRDHTNRDAHVDIASTPAPGGQQVSRPLTNVGGATIMLEDVDASEPAGRRGRGRRRGLRGPRGQDGRGTVEVLDIAGSCATMRYDDNRLILCEGEQIRK